MWIVSQDEKRAFYFKEIFIIDSEEKGFSEIRVVNGGYEGKEVWSTVGKYPNERAEKIFKEILETVGNPTQRLLMPKE